MAKHYSVKFDGIIWYLNVSLPQIWFSKKPTPNSVSSLPKGYRVMKPIKKGMSPYVKKI